MEYGTSRSAVAAPPPPRIAATLASIFLRLLGRLQASIEAPRVAARAPLAADIFGGTLAPLRAYRRASKRRRSAERPLAYAREGTHRRSV